MTEHQYITLHYPQDIILIDANFLPLPKGGRIELEHEEYANIFTTADGSKRKDVIRRYERISVKYELLNEIGYNEIRTIIGLVDTTVYGIKKYIALKRPSMPYPFPGGYAAHYFDLHEIDIIAPLTYSYAFRKNGMFLYQGVTLKIN